MLPSLYVQQPDCISDKLGVAIENLQNKNLSPRSHERTFRHNFQLRDDSHQPIPKPTPILTDSDIGKDGLGTPPCRCRRRCEQCITLLVILQSRGKCKTTTLIGIYTALCQSGNRTLWVNKACTPPLTTTTSPPLTLPTTCSRGRCTVLRVSSGTDVRFTVTPNIRTSFDNRHYTTQQRRYWLYRGWVSQSKKITAECTTWR